MKPKKKKEEERYEEKDGNETHAVVVGTQCVHGNRTIIFI